MFNAYYSDANMPQTILRLPSVKAATGYSRSTIYLRISEGLWPRPVTLGARAVGWPAEEVDKLNAARIAGFTSAQIRQLVKQLEAARASAADKLHSLEQSDASATPENFSTSATSCHKATGSE